MLKKEKQTMEYEREQVWRLSNIQLPNLFTAKSSPDSNTSFFK